jgi:hypothetical protein
MQSFHFDCLHLVVIPTSNPCCSAAETILSLAKSTYSSSQSAGRKNDSAVGRFLVSPEALDPTAQTHQRLLSHSIRLLNRQALRDHLLTPFYFLALSLAAHPGILESG